MNERIEEFQAEVTLPLSELQSVIEDPEIRALIDSCAIKSPGSIGACVQEELLDVLVKKFGGDPADLAMRGEVYTDINMSGEPDVVPGSEGMAAWIRDDPNPPDSELCRPCALPVTVQWYVDTLEEAELHDLSRELRDVGEDQAPLTVAETLDSIKANVSDDVKQRLEEHDATTQANM
jgi:hypothetical protein